MKFWEVVIVFVGLVSYGMIIEHSVVEKYVLHATYPK
jgi:hypothetical protein